MRRLNLRRILVCAVLGLSLALNLVGIDFAQPTHYDQSVDGIHPMLALDAVKNLFGERKVVEHKYPRTHFLLVGVVQRLWLQSPFVEDGERRYQDLMAAFESRPVIPQVELRDSFRPQRETIGELIVCGRVVSALMGTALVLGLFLLGSSLFGFVTGVIAAFLGAVCYPLVFYSHTLNVEVPYLCYGLFAFYFLSRAIRGGGGGWLVLAALFVALSGGTKDQAFGWFFVATPLALWLLARPGALAEEPRRRFPFWSVPVAAGISIGAYLLLIGVPFDMPGVRAHFDHVFGAGVTTYREVPNTLAGQYQLLRLTTLHLIDVMGMPLLTASVVGGIVMLARNFRAALLVLVPAVTYYLTFIAPIGYVYMRFVLPMVLMGLIAAAYLFQVLLRLPAVRYPAVVGLLVILGLRMHLAVELDQMLISDPRPPATTYLQDQLSAGSKVITAAELPLHNIAFPAHAKTVYINLADPLATELPFDAPDCYVSALFPDPRSIMSPDPQSPKEPKELQLLGHTFDLKASFEPIEAHPIQKGAAFQPIILVYARR